MSPHASTRESPTAITRPDPLAHHLARKHITKAQYLAGQEFRRLYAAKDERLARCHAELGQDGSALVKDMLVANLSAKQVAESRGLTGQQWPLYFARRYFECLRTLAETMGFTKE